MPPFDEILIPEASERYGLKWERDTFDLTPVWTVEPSIERIRDICDKFLKQSYPLASSYIEEPLEFLDSGTFNRVYQVDATVKTDASPAESLETGIAKTIGHFNYVFRVSLPVDPRLKSSSEVATIQYLREHTAIPIPRVLDSSQSAVNDLKFEWMLQTYAPGHKLSSIWDKLGAAGRNRMIQHLAEIQTELFKKAKFHKIGNIYYGRDERESDDSAKDILAKSGSQRHFYVGKIVSNPFLVKNATLKTQKRGPFRSTKTGSGPSLITLW